MAEDLHDGNGFREEVVLTVAGQGARFSIMFKPGAIRSDTDVAIVRARYGSEDRGDGQTATGTRTRSSKPREQRCCEASSIAGCATTAATTTAAATADDDEPDGGKRLGPTPAWIPADAEPDAGPCDAPAASAVRHRNADRRHPPDPAGSTPIPVATDGTGAATEPISSRSPCAIKPGGQNEGQ